MDNRPAEVAREFAARLNTRYETRESEQIVRELFRHYLGWSRADLVMRAAEPMADNQRAMLEMAVQRIEQGEPVQYVTGVVWFHGHEFRVSKDVLIPRPETEELVELVLRLRRPEHTRLLDIGTGSGCIAVSIALACADLRVSACDISPGALAMARANARSLRAPVEIISCNILREIPAGTWDILVSNPPYIPLSEGRAMEEHVKAHEPHLALFVPDHDPLIFYRRIAHLLREHAPPGAMAVCEIHPAFAGELEKLGSEHAFHTTIRPDAQQRSRMLVWERNS
jgi:release factor glutamine methyltransferase